MKNKLLKKVVGLFGYRLIEKRIIKNDRLLSKNSSLNINKILESIFLKNNIQNLIQIGANDGLSFDQLNFYIKKYKCRTLLVEPIKTNFLLLKKNYKEFSFINFENCAITINDEISHLYKVDPIYEKNYGNHITAIQSFDKNHLINHGVKNKHIITENVDSLTVLNLIKKHDFKKLDLLFLDCEGYDGKIIFDFLSTVLLRPIIIFEFIHIDNVLFEKLITKLLDKEYLFFSESENMICCPKEKKINVNLYFQ